MRRISPGQRPDTSQPRAAPWVSRHPIGRALKGRDKSGGVAVAGRVDGCGGAWWVVSPLQGWESSLGSVPRTLPWAGLSMGRWPA